MATKKTTSLLSEIEKMEDAAKAYGGVKSWDSALRDFHPERMDQIDAVAADYVSGGISYRKFGSQTDLRNFLVDRGFLPASVKQDSFNRYLRDLRNAKKST